MNKNKKLIGAGIWLYGLACVASNQNTESSVVSSATVKETKTVVIEDTESINIIKSEDGFKRLSNVEVKEAPTLGPTLEPTLAPTLKPTKKVVSTVKSKATTKPIKIANKKTSATQSPSKTKSSTHVKTNNSTNKLYTSIPLSASFQTWIDEKCKEYGISTNVVMGVIKKESGFRIKVMGDNGDAYGLMQVQKKWHLDRMLKVGAKNLLNGYDNTLVGIDFLAELYRANGGNWHKTLMAYNGGQGYANSRVRSGLYSSDYSRKVMNYANEYKRERND